MIFWIILGAIIAFVVGLIIGIWIICLTKTSKEADLHIILLQIMENLKKDRQNAQLAMIDNTKTEYGINYGKYLQTNKTIELIKKLYGGIC